MFSTLISCLALLCGNILTLVVIHSATLLTVGCLEEKWSVFLVFSKQNLTNLALFLSSGLTGSHVIEATATAALESLQSLADDSKGVDRPRAKEAHHHQEAQNLQNKDDCIVLSEIRNVLSKSRAGLSWLFADVLLSWLWCSDLWEERQVLGRWWYAVRWTALLLISSQCRVSGSVVHNVEHRQLGLLLEPTTSTHTEQTGQTYLNLINDRKKIKYS